MKKAARAALFDPGKEEEPPMESVQEESMSPDTDAYWVGALAMTCARARSEIAQGAPELALRELDNTLHHLSHSPVMDDGLRRELAPYWEEPKGEPIQ